MTKNIDINKEFEDYFYNVVKTGSPDNIKRLLKDSFIAGAKAMAYDTIDTLADYGTACAGVDHVSHNSTQAFDMAADNLATYYKQVLP